MLLQNGSSFWFIIGIQFIGGLGHILQLYSNDLSVLGLFGNSPFKQFFSESTDISLAGKVLDWIPEIQLTEGITETSNYFSRIISI